MRRAFLFILLVFSCCLAFGQSIFPNQYIGIWQGNLTIYNDSGEVKMEVPMEFHIDSVVKDSIWTWETHYSISNKKTDIRKYALVKQGYNKYLIDEKNGIVLTATLYETTLVSRFSVQNNLLLFKYKFAKDSLYIEVVTGKEDKKEKTGDIKEKDIPAVYNYNLTGYQKALLKKKGN